MSPDYIVTCTETLPPWKRISGARKLTQVRSMLDDHQLSGNFAIQMRKLIDTDLAAKANIVVHYLQRWAAANKDQFKAFKPKVPALLLFIRMSARYNTRNVIMTEIAERNCLDTWVEEWISAQSEGTAPPTMADESFEKNGEDFNAQTERVQEALTTWKGANKEERHAAVVLAWVASTTNVLVLALSVLSSVKVIDATGPVYHEANKFLKVVFQLLEHCNADGSTE